MQYRALGPLEVVDDDGKPSSIGGAKPRSLIARLLIDRGRPVAIDRLVDDLWGESPPASATATLHSYVSRLRRVLPSGALTTQGASYVLRTQPGEVDIDRFEALVQQGRDAIGAGDHDRAADTLGDALALWRGPALPEVVDSDRGRSEASRLEQIRLAAEEDRFDAELAAGRDAAVLADLERAVADEPLRERRWALLMRALYRAGRQAEALRRYQDLRLVLAEELGIDPSPELTRLEHAILVQDPSLDAVSEPAARPAPRPLPTPLTNFVGRHTETAEVEAAIRANRLVTVVGPGGVGKTRLAIELARARAADNRTERVALVELADFADAAALPAAIANALDADDSRPAELVASVAAALGDDAGLLLLDNCEHLVEACAPVVDQLLRGVARLHVLATSREPLGVAGEAVWRLGPLPPTDAVELLRTRAGAAAAGTEADLAAICERLDRLPLAVELAAARLRSMSVEQLAAGLDDRFRLLGAGPRTGETRHRTLRALIEWSFELLTRDDQALFAALSVFSGSFDVPAVEAVAAGLEGAAPVDGVVRLAELADKSLVVLAPGNRYRMLETIRAYATEQLESMGSAAACRDAHLRWFAAFAAEAGRELRGADQAQWLGRCDSEHANLRAAIEWGIADTSRATSALQMASDLFRFWVVRGHADEGRRLLEAALDASADESAVRAWAQLRAGSLADRCGDTGAARTHQAGALALGRSLGDGEIEAWALKDMGTLARDASDVESALDLGAQAVTTAREHGPAVLGVCLCDLAGSYLAAGQFGRARALFDEARPLLEASGDMYGLSVASDNLAVAAFQEGDMDACRRFAAEARGLHEQLGDRNGVAVTLAALAQAEHAQANYEAADAAATEALEILREVGAPVNVSILLGIAAEIRADRGLDPSDLLDEKLARDRRAGFAAGEATALVVRARFEARTGVVADATATIESAIDAAEASGNDAVRAGVLLAAGDILAEARERDRARAAYHRALPILRDLGQEHRVQHALEGLAAIGDESDEPTRAM